METMNNRRSTLIEYFRSPALAELNWRSLAMVGVTSLAMSILLFAMPLFSLQVYDRVLTSRSTDTLLLLASIVVFALTSHAALDAVRGRLLLRIGNAYAVKLGPLLFDVSIAQSARSSESNGQALRSMQTIRNFVATPQGLATLYDAPLVPLFLVAVYMMHVGLGHAMLFGVIVLFLLTALTEAVTGKRLRAAGEAGIDAQRRVDSVMQNAEAVEAMGMRLAMRRYWYTSQNRLMSDASKANDRSSLVGSVAKWVRMILSLMITGVGAWYVIRDEVTVGAMIAANILSARGLAPLEMTIGAWKSFVGTRMAVEKINSAVAEYSRPEGKMQLPEPKGDVSAEKLVYAPPGTEQLTLKGISFKLPAGTWLGIVGPSGAGKSTLVKLICGVWKPKSGVVRLDGADVYSWPRADFGRFCGYLPQDIELFAGTVRDNIARFAGEDSGNDAAVVEAAKLAGVHEMVLRLSKGYETPIGQGGAALSAGQRQRIGLARAMFGDPRLLVLDEPNSNLDVEGETALLNALSQARSRGCSVIMIGHRPSILEHADYIGVLVEGHLQHFGPREEILARILPKPRASLREVPHGRA